MESYVQESRSRGRRASADGGADRSRSSDSRVALLGHHAATLTQRKLSETLRDSPAAAALTQLRQSLNQSPQAVAQAKLAVTVQPKSDPMTAFADSRLEEEELLQGKFATAQRQDIDEEELLQGKFSEAVTLPLRQSDGRIPATVIQRAQIKNDSGEWENIDIDFSTLTAEEVANIRENLHSLINTNGTYKLDRSEVRELNRRDSELYNAPEARAAREEQARQDDAAALQALGEAINDGEDWELTGEPSHMGESSEGFLQNWELGMTVGELAGVLHLHFNTNEQSEVSKETLGKAHIKTTLASRAGNVPAPEGMVDEAIEQFNG